MSYSFRHAQCTLRYILSCFVDTAFMYMIGWLCMIKIYQTRHPDVNAHAHTAYCIIAFIVFIGVIGVVSIASLYSLEVTSKGFVKIELMPLSHS